MIKLYLNLNTYLDFFMLYLNEITISIFSLVFGFIASIALSKLNNNRIKKNLKKGLKIELKRIIVILNDFESNSDFSSLSNKLKYDYKKIYETLFPQLTELDEPLINDILKFYDLIDTISSLNPSDSDDIFAFIIDNSSALRLGNKIVNKL